MCRRLFLLMHLLLGLACGVSSGADLSLECDCGARIVACEVIPEIPPGASTSLNGEPAKSSTPGGCGLYRDEPWKLLPDSECRRGMVMWELESVPGSSPFELEMITDGPHVMRFDEDGRVQECTFESCTCGASVNP
jgi:hypothetical protein